MRTHGRARQRTTRSFLVVTLLIIVVLVAACQGAAPAAPTAAPTVAAKPATTAAPTAVPGPSGAATAAPAQTAAAKTVSVKIGYQPSYTGAVAGTSLLMSQAIYDYFQQINEQGGFPYKDPKTGETINAKLDVMWEDNGYDTTRIISIYNRQKEAGVKAMLSFGTASLGALADLASKDKMPVAIQGSPTDTTMKPTPRYITVWFNYYDQVAKSFLTYAKANWKESRPPRVGFIHSDGAYGLQYMDGTVDFAKKLGFETIQPEPVHEPFTDVSQQVKRMMDGNPDYVLPGLIATSYAAMMKDAGRLGYRDKTKWVVHSGFWDIPTFQRLAPTETDGTYAWLYWAVENELDKPGVKEAADAVRKYRQQDLGGLYLMGWAFARIFVQGGIKGALEKVGYDALTPESINTSLHSIKNLDMGGLLPAVNTTDDWPVVMSKARLVQWKDNKVSILSDWQEGNIR